MTKHINIHAGCTYYGTEMMQWAVQAYNSDERSGGALATRWEKMNGPLGVSRSDQDASWYTYTAGVIQYVPQYALELLVKRRTARTFWPALARTLKRSYILDVSGEALRVHR